jgi:hypothetical protein
MNGSFCGGRGIFNITKSSSDCVTEIDPSALVKAYSILTSSVPSGTLKNPSGQNVILYVLVY